MTPREKFRSNRTLTKGYNDAVHGFQMQSALDAATMEHDLQMPATNEIQQAAANRWRKEGATRFRQILENLNADSAQAAPIPTGQLTRHD